MLKTYEALLNNDGQLTWLDTPPIASNAKVLVTIIDSIDDNQSQGQRRIGSLAGKATFPDDINKYDDEVARLFGVEL